jgi:hypothetical protein
MRLGPWVTIPRADGKASQTIALPLARGAPQGCVALGAPVLRTPLPRAGFAVAGKSDDG